MDNLWNGIDRVIVIGVIVMELFELKAVRIYKKILCISLDSSHHRPAITLVTAFKITARSHSSVFFVIKPTIALVIVKLDLKSTATLNNNYR